MGDRVTRPLNKRQAEEAGQFLMRLDRGSRREEMIVFLGGGFTVNPLPGSDYDDIGGGWDRFTIWSDQTRDLTASEAVKLVRSAEAAHQSSIAAYDVDRCAAGEFEVARRVARWAHDRRVRARVEAAQDAAAAERRAENLATAEALEVLATVGRAVDCVRLITGRRTPGRELVRLTNFVTAELERGATFDAVDFALVEWRPERAITPELEVAICVFRELTWCEQSAEVPRRSSTAKRLASTALGRSLNGRPSDEVRQWCAEHQVTLRQPRR